MPTRTNSFTINHINENLVPLYYLLSLSQVKFSTFLMHVNKTGRVLECLPVPQLCLSPAIRTECSDKWKVIFPANRNRNRFAEPISVQIGIGIVCELQNLRIGIGIIFVTWAVFANYSQIPEIYFFSSFVLIIPYSQLLYVFFCEKFTWQTKPKWDICLLSIYIQYKNKIFMNTWKKHLWIGIIFIKLQCSPIGKIFMNWNCGK